MSANNPNSNPSSGPGLMGPPPVPASAAKKPAGKMTTTTKTTTTTPNSSPQKPGASKVSTTSSNSPSKPSANNNNTTAKDATAAAAAADMKMDVDLTSTSASTIPATSTTTATTSVPAPATTSTTTAATTTTATTTTTTTPPTTTSTTPPGPPAPPPSDADILKAQIAHLEGLRERVRGVRQVPPAVLTAPLRHHEEGWQGMGVSVNALGAAAGGGGTATAGGGGAGAGGAGGSENAMGTGASGIGVGGPGASKSVPRAAFAIVHGVEGAALSGPAQEAMERARESMQKEEESGPLPPLTIADVRRVNRKRRRAQSPEVYVREAKETVSPLGEDGPDDVTLATLGAFALEFNTTHEAKMRIKGRAVRLALPEVMTVLMVVGEQGVGGRAVVQTIRAFGVGEKVVEHGQSAFEVFRLVSQQLRLRVEEAGAGGAGIGRVAGLVMAYRDLFTRSCRACGRVTAEEGHVPCVVRRWTGVAGGWSCLHGGCMIGGQGG